MPKAWTSVGERVWRRVAVAGPDDCWLWTGATNGRYGKLGAGGRDGKTVYAHRVAYEAVKGPIPVGHEIDHLCRRPLCCNPAHLDAVLPKENKIRSDCPTALNARKTHCPQGHPYTKGNIYWRKQGWRECRTCVMAAARRYREAQRVG